MNYSPFCSQTKAQATYFCCTPKCTLAAFCCGEPCLAEHSHKNKDFMFWEAISPGINELVSHPIPKETLELLEGQEKKIKILTDELSQMAQRNAKRIA